MATEVADGLWRLRLARSNAYLVAEPSLALVDVGMRWEADAIETHVRETGHDLAAVERILVTHYDVDHVGTLAALAGDIDAVVHAGSPDAAFIAGDERPPLRPLKGAIQRAVGWLSPPPDLEVRAVADGDRVGGFEAFRTPGHTPGHTVYVHRGHRAAFLGDLVATKDGGFVPVGRRSNYDAAAADRSLRRFAERAPRFEIACPGHGRPIATGASAALRAFADRKR